MERINAVFDSELTIEASEGEERRIIAGTAVPWNVPARVSSGQLVKFLPGSLTLAGMPVIRDHDSTHPIGIVASETADSAGLQVKTRISKVAAGDDALILATDKVLGAFSVGADPVEYAFEETDNGERMLVVSKAEGHDLSLLVRGAFADAKVSLVAASPHDERKPMSDESTQEVVTPEIPATVPTVPIAAGPNVAVTSEPFPYSFNGFGPSLIRDIAMRGEDEAAARRVIRAQAMLNDTKLVQAGMSRIMAATGTTAPASHGSIVPPGYRPDLYAPLIAYEAPVWSNLTKYPIADFTPFTIPREKTRTGLSGTPADEVTPVAAGDIVTELNTVTPQHVMGKYQFSRDLALSSNPAIDMIAMNAMDEEWLKDVEGRAITFFLAVGNSTDKAATYADGKGFVTSMRAAIANFRITRKAAAEVIVTPGAKEYSAAIAADDSSGRPLLGWNQSFNAVGQQSDAAAEANILGVPLLPDGTAPLTAGHTLMWKRSDAVAFTTPVWNFRFESDATNPLVLTLVKYSGVAFWRRYQDGIFDILNTTPIADDAASGLSDRSAKGK